MSTPQRFNPHKQFTGSFIPLWLMERAEISPGAKLIYARLALHAGEEGDRAFPGIVTLAQEIGLPWTEAKVLSDGSIRAADSRSVRAYLKELVDKGLIECVQRGFNKPNRYYFLRHDWMEDGLNQGSAKFADPDRQDLPIMTGKICRLKQTDLKDSEKTTTTDVVESFNGLKIQSVEILRTCPQEKNEEVAGCAVLREAGVNGRMAKVLSQSHSLARIKEVVDLAREKERANPAGFIVTALKEGWQAGESQGIHSKGTNIDDLIAKAQAEEAKDGGRDAVEIKRERERDRKLRAAL